MTPEEIAVVQMAAVVGEAIRDLTQVSPLKGVPAGHLYARLYGRMTLEQFNGIIAMLERAQLVKRLPSHLLTWVGPVQ